MTLADRERARKHRNDETPPDRPPESNFWIWVMVLLVVGLAAYGIYRLQIAGFFDFQTFRP